MPHQYTTSLAACCSLFCFSSIFSESASAEPVDFRLWFEGPTQVLAGEVATFQAWAEVSGPELDDAIPDALETMRMSIRATSFGNVFESFSPASAVDGSIILGDPGTPENDMLVNIQGFQLLDFNPTLNTDNPIYMFDFSIQTIPGSNGVIDLLAVDTPSWGAPFLGWDINYTRSNSDDPGNTLTIDPFSFQVVPAPGAAALLALAGLRTTRRRRQENRRLAPAAR